MWFLLLLRDRACATLLIIVGILSSGCRTQDIISPYCRISDQHTLCKFQGVGENCDSLSIRGLDEKSQQVILQAHNTLRSLVASGEEIRGAPGPQPQASNMQVMIWDEELAIVAQRHADQCQFVHDCNDCRKVDRFPVGQNLGIEWTTGPPLASNWKKMITKWYEEVEMFPNSSVTRYQFAVETGHYSQLIWAETNRVGCGYTSYKSNVTASEQLVETNLYVCNYGPAANFVDLPVYKAGPSCSQCPANTVCSSLFTHLCESVKKPSGDVSTNAITVDTANKTTLLPSSIPESSTSTAATVSTTILTTVEDAFTTQMTSLASFEEDAPCLVGIAPCLSSYRGSSWSFRTEPSAISPRFLETDVKVGDSTELQVNRLYPNPGPDGEVCMSFKMRQDGLIEGWLAPPVLIKIQPEKSQPLTIPVRSGEIGVWVQVKLALSRIRNPFRVLFQQSGPLLVDQVTTNSSSSTIRDSREEASLRLALEALHFNSGNCQP